MFAQYTSTKLFRNLYRMFIALTAVAIVALAFSFSTKSQAVMLPCATNTVGSANITASFDTATPAVVWVQISNSAAVDLEAKVNNTCAKKSFPTMANGDLNWQKFDDQFNFNSGSNNLSISSFGGVVTLYKIALVTDGQTPTGDGNNVVVVNDPTTTTQPVVTTQPPVTTTQPGTPTTKAPVTTAPVTTQPGTPTTKAPVTTGPVTTAPVTTQPGTPTTKAPVTTGPVVTSPVTSTPVTDSTVTTTTSVVNTTPTSAWTTVIQPPSTTSPVVVNNPSTNPTTAPGITVAGTHVSATTPAPTSNANTSLPFTGSSSRMMLIVALSAMLAGLIAVGISKKYLLRS